MNVDIYTTQNGVQVWRLIGHCICKQSVLED